MKPGAGNTLASVTSAQVLYCEIGGMEVGVDAEDFSPAGFYVQTLSLPRLDSEVEIFLRSEFGSVTVSAMVVKVVSLQEATHSGGTPGFGALFTDLSESDRTFLVRTSDEVKRSLQPPKRPKASRTPQAQESPKAPQAQESSEPSRAQESPKAPQAQESSEPSRAQPAHAPGDAPLPTPMARPIRVTKNSLQPDRRPATGSSREAARVLMELHAMLDRDAQRAAWRVLGVAADASVRDAKRAFLSLAKQHHPHVYARHKDPQISDAATRLFILQKKAYSTFCKEAARRKGSDQLVIETPDKKDVLERGTQHTARLWNERRGKADG